MTLKKRKDNFVKRHKILTVIAIIVLVYVAAVVISAINTNKKHEAQRVALAAKKARLAADPITVSNFYNALNKERAKTGAKALSSNSNLTTAAKQYCNDMVKYKYFSYKNPETGKDSNSFIIDNTGSLYFRYYVSSIYSAKPSSQTATAAVKDTLKSQSTNLNDNKYNSVGWYICKSPKYPKYKFVVAMLADIEDKPATPQTIYVPRSVPPVTNSSSSPFTHCDTTYNSYGNPYDEYPDLPDTASTNCY